MPGEPKHKTVVHFNPPGHVHFLTFSYYNDLPLLNDDELKALFSQSLNRALERHNFSLLAFVYMPEHAQLLVWPQQEKYDVSRFLSAVKRPFSFRAKRFLAQTRGALIKVLTVRERLGKHVFRFWQEGPGHDHNIFTLKGAVKAAEYIHNNPVRRGLCASPDNWEWSSWKYHCRREEYDSSDLPNLCDFPV